MRDSSGRSPTYSEAITSNPEYGKVILPLTVLRRLDCVLELTKGAVLDRTRRLKGRP
jgi:type I restriction-modification system DNA methylase subunit